MDERIQLARRGHLGELFFQIRDAVAVLDPDWRIEVLNPGGERLLGYSSDVLAGKPFADLFAYPSEFESRLAALAESVPPLAHGAGSTVIAHLRSRAGRVFPARIKALKIASETGSRLAVLMHEEPAGDLDESDQALIRQVDQMAETARSIIGATDLNVVCQAFADLAKELIGADFTAVVLGSAGATGAYEFSTFAYNAPRHLFPEHLPRPVGLLALAIESRNVVRLDDIRTHPAAVGIPVKHPPIAPLLAVPLIHGQTVIGELVAANRVGRPAFTPLDESVARHLGTLVVAGVEGARLQAELARLEHAKSDFLRLASHELRGPLAVLGGYCSMLGEGTGHNSESLPAISRVMQAQVGRMDTMVEQMLETARLEDGRLQLQLEDLDLATLLNEEIERARQRLASDRELEFDAPERPVLVRADRLRISSIFSILIDNALKYSPLGQPVLADLSIEGPLAVVRVVDRGFGIAESDLERLFEPFSRITTPDTIDIPGTGLGLHLARSLARLHGGDLKAESTPGQGSTFTVSLPMGDARGNGGRSHGRSA